jgi:3-oxoacyl-[acyl-carrier protein] reductase
VVLVARTQAALEELGAEIRAMGGRSYSLALDLSQAEGLPERIAELPKEFSDIDILVHNAGITADNLLLRMSLEEWRRVLDTNLTGTFVLTKALVRGMMRRRWGRIVTISSVVGLMGNAGQANYAAAKAGLIGFTKSLAKELASRGVTANVVAPGYVETAMTAALPEAVRQEMLAGIPMGRSGRPEEIAAAVGYLASEEAGYITGAVLNISGGLWM